jgi:hypothetical protein
MGFAVFVAGAKSVRHDFSDGPCERGAGRRFAAQDDEAPEGQRRDLRADLDGMVLQSQVADGGFDLLAELLDGFAVGQFSLCQQVKREDKCLVDGRQAREATPELTLGELGL